MNSAPPDRDAQQVAVASTRMRRLSLPRRKEIDVIALRPLRWPDDRASLLGLDTSFTPDRVFHLEQTNHGFKL